MQEGKMVQQDKTTDKKNSFAEALQAGLLTLGTIYTAPDDSFQSLAGYDVDETLIKTLNPHVAELEQLEAGIPLDVPLSSRKKIVPARLLRETPTPYDIARRELELGVREDSRPGHDNPRIRAYHAATQGGAMPDEVAWCSSFVCYCVEQAGLGSTNSKAARSWMNWGKDVGPNDWREGDIVVFWRERKQGWKGHVAFLVTWDGERPRILGGNQGNRVCIDDPYPFGNILSVRRG